MTPLPTARAAPRPHVLLAHQETCHPPVPKAGEEEHVPPWPLKPSHDTRTCGCLEASTVQGKTARVAM